jgi:hypothetical protein
MMIPSTVLQDAIALLTVAMNTDEPSELEELVAEFQAKDRSDQLLIAVVALCRSLCLATSKMIHVVDDALSDHQADALTEDDLLPVAMDVIRQYAHAAARNAAPAS